MKEYPTIFARSNTGKVLIWKVQRDGEKYRTISGSQDGAKITSDWTTADAKNVGRANETSAEAQAEAEIESKYTKQLKSGGYNESIDDIDTDKFYQVMLAKDFAKYKDKLDWSKGVGIQIKYNGGRVLAKKDGLWTRKGERYISIPHIEEGLAPFFDKFPNAVLDGEGFNYALRERLCDIMSLLRKTVRVSPEDLEQSKELIRFYIYDGFGFPSKKDGSIISSAHCYLDRKAAIDNAFFAPCFADKYKDIIHHVPTWVVKSESELEKLYQSFLKDKQEGAILRVLGVPYENKRSKYLLKYKPVDDYEFRIIAVNEGVGKFANRVATFTCKRTDGKKFDDGTDTFEATFKGTAADAVKCWKERAKFINKVVTIYYNGLTGYGKPNYARFDYLNYDKGH